jgi:hypothetical protein
LRIAHQTASRIPAGKWRVLLTGARISESARQFALEVLAPLAARSGRVRPTAAGELAARYARHRDRTSITTRRVRQLLAELRGAGVLDRAGRPAPGRPARYVTLLPGTDYPRPMIIRPRGIASRRLHAAFAREAGADPPEYLTRNA